VTLRRPSALAPALAALATCCGACASARATAAPVATAEARRPAPQEPPSIELRERAAEMRVFRFALRPGESLRLSDFDGDVRVVAAQRDTTEVHAHLGVFGSTRRAATARLSEIRFETTEAQDEHVLRLVKPAMAEFLTHSSYDVWVPFGTSVSLATSAGGVDLQGPLGACEVTAGDGDVRISDARGRVSARTAAGDLHVEDVDAPHLHLTTVHGGIELRASRGQCIELVSASGDMRIEDVETRAASLVSEHGWLQLERVRGDVSAQTLSGNITLRTCRGAGIVLDTEYGDIETSDSGTSISARSRTGGVELHECAGSVVARTNVEDLHVSGQLEAVVAQSVTGAVEVHAAEGSRAERAWQITSGSGDVLLGLPASFPCAVEAHSGRGRIVQGVPIEADAGRAIRPDFVSGTLDAGGRLVRLASASGRVTIQRSAHPGPR
jgi:DUF4097 and DUF4098 domain-containing protein YvlB